jgi:hypothetical protein
VQLEEHIMLMVSPEWRTPNQLRLATCPLETNPETKRVNTVAVVGEAPAAFLVM